MHCPYCNTENKEGAALCEYCGRPMPGTDSGTSGVQAIRQGKRAREERAERARRAAEKAKALQPGRRGVSRGGASVREDRKPPREGKVYGGVSPEEEHRIQREPKSRTVYGEHSVAENIGQVHKPRRRRKATGGKRPINWAHMLILGLVAVVLLVVGTLVYLLNTAGGQRIMARMGRDASSAALWEVGEEKYDTGDVMGAIDMFLRAAEKDGEDNVNVPGMLTLGTAYESVGMVEEAEALYRYLFTDVVPAAVDPYTNTIRILLAQERNAEAADLMLLAYQNTGNSLFNTQRRELLPQPPEVNIGAGTYDQARTLMIMSPEGYDVYYTLSEEAVLPQEGVLFTTPIYMDEGFWRVRAVAVNGDLVSDVLTAVYRIVMPSPGTPECNLAPNTYSRRISVKLRKNPDNEKDDDILIYYTIDGSMPNEDSPIYDGNAIVMPAGTVTLQAVAVNKYGKASNTFSRTFKFDVKPLPLKGYTIEDTCNGVELYTTTLEQFQAKYGTETSQEIVTLDHYDEPGVRYHYKWGYAAFVRERGVSRLVELYVTGTLKGPRGTEVGMTETAVIAKFRDMGQVASPSGNRGLYSTTNSLGNITGTGKFYKDLNGQRLIRYETVTADSHNWRLDYILTPGGVVKAIDMVYIP